MTFLDRETTREAQAVRRSVKDRKGRPAGKFTTPDRPDTNLGWSTTGQGNGAMSDMQRAFAAVELPDNLKPRKRKPQGKRPGAKPKGGTRPARTGLDTTAQHARKAGEAMRKTGPAVTNVADAMRRMAAAAKPKTDA
jgi:hypothetical protein